VVVEENGGVIREKESLYQSCNFMSSSSTGFDVGGVPGLVVLVRRKVFCCDRLLGCLKEGGPGTKDYELNFELVERNRKT
jgi:hypothetical protein